MADLAAPLAARSAMKGRERGPPMHGLSQVGPAALLAAAPAGLPAVAVLGEGPGPAPARVLGTGQGGAGPAARRPPVGQGLVAEDGDGLLDAVVVVAGALVRLGPQRRAERDGRLSG